MQSETPISNEMPDIGSRYQLESQVGSGGMGAVYRAFDTVLDKVVAIKVLSVDLTSEVAVRFHTEAKATAKLDHPNIVKVLHFGQTEEGALYLIMDFIEGPTLDQYIKSRGPLAFESALPIFSEICAGLKHAHAHGILHRDVKPSNIILAPKLDGYYQVKVLDFGLAKLETEDQMLTAAGVRMGSPPYMSPEQARGESVDQRSDIYSMGCLMFKVLIGKPPIVGDSYLDTIVRQTEDTPPLLNDNDAGLVFPALLEQTISKLLEKDPAKRFQSFGELQAAIDELQGNREAVSEFPQTAIGIDTRYNTIKEHDVGSKSVVQHWKFFVAALICLAAPVAFLVFRQLKSDEDADRYRNMEQKHRQEDDSSKYFGSQHSEGSRSDVGDLWHDQTKKTYLKRIARLYKEPEFAENMKDPAVTQFLVTPEVWTRWNKQTAMKFADQKNIQQIMKNPRFVALTKDKEFQKLMRDARFRNYVTDAKAWKDVNKWPDEWFDENNRGWSGWNGRRGWGGNRGWGGGEDWDDDGDHHDRNRRIPNTQTPIDKSLPRAQPD